MLAEALRNRVRQARQAVELEFYLEAFFLAAAFFFTVFFLAVFLFYSSLLLRHRFAPNHDAILTPSS